MNTKKVLFLIIYEVVIIGAFVACFPMLVRIFSNPITAVIFTGVIVAGCGVVVSLAFLSCRHCGGRMKVDRYLRSFCPYCNDKTNRINSLMR